MSGGETRMPGQWSIEPVLIRCDLADNVWRSECQTAEMRYLIAQIEEHGIRGASGEEESR
jgi:hypothetical protein